MFLPIGIQYDTTALEGQIASLEGDALCFYKHLRMKYLYMLNNTQDGDKVIAENGSLVIWSDTVRTAVVSELDGINARIAELES